MYSHMLFFFLVRLFESIYYSKNTKSMLWNQMGPHIAPFGFITDTSSSVLPQRHDPGEIFSAVGSACMHVASTASPLHYELSD